MNKRVMIAVVCLVVFCTAGIALGWQGRMAGMADPTGLVQDESDFLIHPAEIANIPGVHFYGNVDFDFHSVHRLNNSMTYFDSAGAVDEYYPFRTSGSERKFDSTIGATVPLGQGTLGLFLQYSSNRGKFDGNAISPDVNDVYSLSKELQSLDMRAIYGVPVGSWKVGGEFELAYRNREDETFTNTGGQFFTNNIIGAQIPYFNTFPLMLPNDSNWWEANFKLSAKGQLGPGTLTITPHFGFVFGGDNNLHYQNVISPATLFEDITFKGNVSGWNAGGDIWWRMPMGGGLSLPLLVRVDYDSKKWDGSGINNLLGTPLPMTYENEEKNLVIEAGGGLDKEFTLGTRIAGGIYYNYIESDNSFLYTVPSNLQVTDHTNYPDSTEHRIVLKLAAENMIAPQFTARMGINAFYGWAREKYNFIGTSAGVPFSLEQVTPSGSHYGVLVALGGTMKIDKMTLEPYVKAGYQKLDIDSNSGTRPTSFQTLSVTKKIEETSIGAGVSVKF
ncbi:MAG TPA: hypothetical protein VMB78_09490 [Dissulfurispiraceae bacterium]|nr:hypothetical protein [Dissulfurispiraceae bacterium]